MNESLSGLTIGSLTLTPSFDSEVTEYSATTTNATNKVTATATDPADVISIKLNGESIENGASAEWDEGENELVITVTDTNASPARVGTYTVTVTKESEPPESPPASE